MAEEPVQARAFDTKGSDPSKARPLDPNSPPTVALLLHPPRKTLAGGLSEEESYVFAAAATTRRPSEQSNSSSMVEQKDSSFKLSRSSEDWKHGCELPYVAVKLDPVQEGKKVKLVGETVERRMFEPHLVMEKVNNVLYNPIAPPPPKTPPPLTPLLTMPAEVVSKNETSQGFSGYFYLPNRTLRYHKPTDLSTTYTEDELRALIFHNTHQLEDVVYTFGGFVYSKYNNLAKLGIPESTPLKKISVHFPCELPPHVNKNLVMNPFLTPNNMFIKRLTSTGNHVYLDFTTLKGYKESYSPVCMMESCQLSPTQIFYYGGFILNTDSVTYNSEAERWVIEKSLTMNEKVYILDTFDMRIATVELNLVQGSSLLRGRIGHALVSVDNWSPDGDGELIHSPTSTSLPPIFSDSPSNHSLLSDPSNVSIYNTYSSLTQNLRSSILRPNSPMSPLVSGSRPVSPIPPLVSTPQLKAADSQPSPSVVERLTVDSGAPELVKFPTDLPPKISRSNTSSSTQSSSTTSSSVTKVVSALGKSKFFHRQHQRNQSSTSTPATSGSSLKNTYSKQVKQHRSNSFNNNASRPVSPVAKTAVSVLTPLSTTASTSTTSTSTSTSISSSNNTAIKPTPRMTTADHSSSKKGSPLVSEDLSFEVKSPPMTPHLNTTRESPRPHTKEEKDPQATSTCKSDPQYDWKDEDVPNATTLDIKKPAPTVSVYVFGGFVGVGEGSISSFEASNQLFRIDLPYSASYAGFFEFEDECSVKEIIKPGTKGKKAVGSKETIWPLARGFFAYTLIDHNTDLENSCQIDLFRTTSPDRVSVDEDDDRNNLSPIQGQPVSPSSPNSFTQGVRDALRSNFSAATTGVNHRGSNALLVQGGCNEHSETFSDFYVYVIRNEQWQTLSTYAYDYFEQDLQPDEDDDCSKLTEENTKPLPALVEAELRSCHHTALYHSTDDQHFIFFIGGLTNDYLRHFDISPYQSDKFDVLRLLKFQFVTKNNYISRIMILNLETQTWRFLRYYYDVSLIMSASFLLDIVDNPGWINARICNIAGSVTLSGRKLVVSHGQIVPVAEKRKNQEELNKMYKGGVLSGTQFVWTFPSL